LEWANHGKFTFETEILGQLGMGCRFFSRLFSFFLFFSSVLFFSLLFFLPIFYWHFSFLVGEACHVIRPFMMAGSEQKPPG
jgi:hypothetical protein